MKHYASLIGPLLDIYYPLPFEDETRNRIALNTSKLGRLWCTIYTEEEVDDCIKNFGGIKLSEYYAERLDYNYDEVFNKG